LADDQHRIAGKSGSQEVSSWSPLEIENLSRPFVTVDGEEDKTLPTA
jgi:hypothetical protein